MSQAVKLIRPRRLGDDRGWFMEVYSETAFAGHGIDLRFVQDNHSLSVRPGTIRGIHFQRPPRAQAKLVRCLSGRIVDYAVDLRRGSATYGHHVGVELSAENGWQLFLPVGFGHAFVTLEPNSEVAYKVTDGYARDCDGGILWNDPTIGIRWPLPRTGAVLSAKDRTLPTLAAFDSPFDDVGPPLEPFEGVIAGTGWTP